MATFVWGYLFPHFYFHGFQGKKHYCLHVLGPPLQHLDLSLRTFKTLLCRETFSKKDAISCRKKDEKKKPAHFERCCLPSPSLPFPRAVPSWHHSSAARRSGTVGRSSAARRQSACRAPPAATWLAFPTAGSLSWQPGKNKQGSLSSSLSIYNTAELNKSPQSSKKLPDPPECFTFPGTFTIAAWRHSRTVLQTSRDQDKPHSSLIPIHML